MVTFVSATDDRPASAGDLMTVYRATVGLDPFKCQLLTALSLSLPHAQTTEHIVSFLTQENHAVENIMSSAEEH